MGIGESKLKAKFAGIFVTFRGFISIAWIAYDVLKGVETGLLFLFSFLISIATFASGLGVLIGSKKGYMAATALTLVHAVFFSGSILGLLLDIAVLGALWKGWSIQIKEDHSIRNSPDQNY